MKMRKGLSLLELLVVIAIIAFLLAILMPMHGKVPKIAQRVICGTNLKSLGTAMQVYADDFNGNYPQLPGNGPWSKRLGFDYNLKNPDFSSEGAEGRVSRTITASWYLLVRQADVAPKSFVCPASDQKEFESKNTQNRDITEFWDFGFEPHKQVSYPIQNPYGRFPSHNKLSAAFGIAADMNPWFEHGNIIENPKETVLQRTNNPYMPFDKQLYNSYPHVTEGQNVLFADGHSSYETRPDVGVRYDNIYTYWRITTNENPNELDKRIGRPPTGRNPENDAKDKDDSFLAI